MERLSEYLISNLFMKTITNSEQKEIYKYGMTILITTVLGIASILFVSVAFFNSIAEGLCFLIVFSLLRIHAGGYHCKTYRNCFFVSNLVFILVVFSSRAMQIIETQLLVNIIVLLLVGSWVYVLVDAPVLTHNHQLSAKRVAKNRRRSVFWSSVFSCCGIVAIIIFNNLSMIRYFCTIISITESIVSILMLITKYNERRKSNV